MKHVFVKSSGHREKPRRQGCAAAQTLANIGPMSPQPEPGPDFQTLYAELRRIAQRELYKIGSGAQMSATTVLHEAYLQLQGRSGLHFADREHFMAYASRAMRGIVIDNARARSAQKRGGDLDFVTFDTLTAENACAPADAAADELEHISEAVEQLALIDAKLAELVDMKFFVGLSFLEIAALRGVSERTAQRDWDKARALLLGLVKR